MGAWSASLKPALPRGLYVITDRQLCTHTGLVESVRAALRGGAAIVQYRDKTSDGRRRRQEASEVCLACKEAGALFVVNDDPELARHCQAGGVHLGAQDPLLSQARRIVGEDILIGVSCYDSLARARDAVVSGCDYVAFGSAFPSPTKPGAVRAPLSLFEEAVATLPVPVVAIGGITPANAGALISAGCRAVAVISGVFGQADSETAARSYARLFEPAAEVHGLE